MKFLSITFLTAFMMLVFHSCKKDETKVMMNNNKPVLSSDNSGPLVLLKANEDQRVITFSWDKVNYGFDDALKYILQISKTEDFKQVSELSVEKTSLNTMLSVKALNAELLKIAQPEQSQKFSFRLKSDVGNVISNVITILITPYLDVKYPLPEKLFIVGSATPGGWVNPMPEDQELGLDSAAPGVYKITIELTGGGSYLFLPVRGSWDPKYGFDGESNKNNPMGDNFKPGGGDLLAPSETGRYEISVDFVTGRVSLTKKDS